MNAPASDRPRSGIGPAGPGLYVHVPFCKARCGYCDFYTLASGSEPLMARTVAALVAEAGEQAERWRGGPFDSVFIGGGTPSHLGPRLLEDLLGGLRARLPIAVGAEWTIEANPESATEACLDAAVQGGVNRLSLGVQSLDDALLAALDRLHDASAAEAAFARARRAGCAQVGIDLIYGLPGTTSSVWRATLERAIGFAPDHVSCYCLSLEPQVPMARRGGKVAGDVQARNEYDLARRMLLAAGYRHYEISNWSRPGMECRHNVNVWRGGDYLGLGPGAHGHVAGVRRANRPDLGGYLEAIESGAEAPHDMERIEGVARAEERLMLGLRLHDGIAWAALGAEFGSDGAGRLRERAFPLVRGGLLEDDGERLRIGDAGLFVSNALTAELLGVS